MTGILYNVHILAFIAALIAIAFCAGVFVPVFVKASASATGQFFGFVRRRAGYFASFAGGGLIVALFTTTMSPYYLIMWSDSYEAVQLGQMLLHDDSVIETGQIPQEYIDWYNARAENRH